jgi:hypothetical protein
MRAGANPIRRSLRSGGQRFPRTVLGFGEPSAPKLRLGALCIHPTHAADGNEALSMWEQLKLASQLSSPLSWRGDKYPVFLQLPESWVHIGSIPKPDGKKPAL